MYDNSPRSACHTQHVDVQIERAIARPGEFTWAADGRCGAT
jgi:hypothetical protein